MWALAPMLPLITEFYIKRWLISTEVLSPRGAKAETNGQFLGAERKIKLVLRAIARPQETRASFRYPK